MTREVSRRKSGPTPLGEVSRPDIDKLTPDTAPCPHCGESHPSRFHPMLCPARGK